MEWWEYFTRSMQSAFASGGGEPDMPDSGTLSRTPEVGRMVFRGESAFPTPPAAAGRSFVPQDDDGVAWRRRVFPLSS